MNKKSPNDLFVAVTEEESRWIVNKDGELEELDKFTIPIEHDPETGKRLGVLVEPPSTNHYPHAKKMDDKLDLDGFAMVDAIGANSVQFFPTVLYCDASQKNRVEDFNNTENLPTPQKVQEETRSFTFVFDNPKTWTYYGVSFFMRFPFDPSDRPQFGKSDDVGTDFFIRFNGLDASTQEFGAVSVKKMKDGSYWVRARLRAPDRPVNQITIGNGYYQTEKDFVIGGLQLEPYMNTSPIITDGELKQRDGLYLRFKATPNKTINMEQGTYEIGWNANYGSVGSALFAFNSNEEILVDVEEEKEAFIEKLRKEIQETKKELVDDLGIPEGDPDDPCLSEDEIPSEKGRQLKQCLKGLKINLQSALCTPESAEGDQTLEIGHIGESQDNHEEEDPSHSIECDAPTYKYHFCYGNENRDYNIKDWESDHNVRMTFSPYGHRFVTNCSPLFRSKDFNYMENNDPPTVFHLGISKLGEHMNGHIRYFNIIARALTNEELPFNYCFSDDPPIIEPPEDPETPISEPPEPPGPPEPPEPEVCPFIVSTEDSDIDDLINDKEFDLGIKTGIVTVGQTITNGELGLKVFRNNELVAEKTGLTGNGEDIEFQYTVRDKVLIESESSVDNAEWEYTVSCPKEPRIEENSCPFLISSDDEEITGKVHQEELDFGTTNGVVNFDYEVGQGAVAFRIFKNGKLLTGTGGFTIENDNIAFLYSSVDKIIIETEKNELSDKWSYTASCPEPKPLSNCPFTTSFDNSGIDGNLTSRI